MMRVPSIGFSKKLIAWFQVNHRKLPWRETSDAYPIWISEVMLQQTQVVKVQDFYSRFIEKFPTIQLLAEADVQDVLKAWEGLGYYSRARNLHHAARMVVEEMDGQIPNDVTAFRRLPGVGEYIAAAVLSRAFQLPLAVVDGNVKRVLARVFLIPDPVNISSTLKKFTRIAQSLMDESRPGMFNEALMELGATICRPQKPRCPVCPVNGFCLAFRNGQQTQYPVKTKTRATPTHHIVVGVIYKKERFLIIRRPLSGLLGGMWEFPGGRVQAGEDAEIRCVEKIREKTNLRVEITGYLTRVKHAYTHFKILMDVYRCRYVSGRIRLTGPMDSRWIVPEEIDHFPFHIANHKFLSLLRKSA